MSLLDPQLRAGDAEEGYNEVTNLSRCIHVRHVEIMGSMTYTRWWRTMMANDGVLCTVVMLAIVVLLSLILSTISTSLHERTQIIIIPMSKS